MRFTRVGLLVLLQRPAVDVALAERSETNDSSTVDARNPVPAPSLQHDPRRLGRRPTHWYDSLKGPEHNGAETTNSDDVATTVLNSAEIAAEQSHSEPNPAHKALEVPSIGYAVTGQPVRPVAHPALALEALGSGHVACKAGSPANLWTDEEHSHWLSRQCTALQQLSENGVTFYPDDTKVFDHWVSLRGSESRGEQVTPAGRRIAMVFPWVNWGKGVVTLNEVPAFFKYWAQSAGLNAELIDFLLFTSSVLEPSLAAATRGIGNIKIHVIDDFSGLYSKALGIPDLMVDGEMLKDLKPMHGLVFEDFLKGYSHWGFGDLDVLYGNLTRFLAPLLAQHDIVTLGAVDSPPLDSTNHLCKWGSLFAGQFTVIANNDYNRNLFERVPEYQRVIRATRRRLGRRPGHTHVLFDEKLFPKAVLGGPESDANRTGVAFSQLTDQFGTLTNKNIVWSRGQLLILDERGLCVDFEASLLHLMGIKNELKFDQSLGAVFSDEALGSAVRSVSSGSGGVRIALPAHDGAWKMYDGVVPSVRCSGDPGPKRCPVHPIDSATLELGGSEIGSSVAVASEKFMAKTSAPLPYSATAQCLEEVSFVENVTFSWGGEHERRGTCENVQSAFGLCDERPSRECLLARVPWQSHLQKVTCCFRCCVDYWQNRLGLVDIYNHWWNNPDFETTYFERNYARHTIPPLDHMLLHPNILKRFSIFMLEIKDIKDKTDRSQRRILHNATQFLSEIGGGGVVFGYHIGNNIFQMFGNAGDPISSRAYISSHPVSGYFYSDQEHVPWFSPPPGILPHIDFSHGGGHLYIANSGDDDSPVLRTMPLGAYDVKISQWLASLSPEQNRTKLMSCCCMNTRRGRDVRARELVQTGACVEAEGLPNSRKSVRGQEYVRIMATSRFVWSPSGEGYACFRDAESVYAGAVPVLDGHHSGGALLYDDSFPAIHIPECVNPFTLKVNPAYCHPEDVTPAFLEAEYAKLEERRGELNTAKVYWPYWLYHVFKQIPVPEEA